MRYSPGHKDETHQRLLKVAADAIRVDGPDQVSVSSVMAHAGLTHGGFYAHFSSKDELVVGAISTMFEESKTRFLLEASEYSPAEGLWRYIRFYLSRAHRDTKATSCPVAALLTEMTRASESVATTFSKGTSRLRKQLAEQLLRMGDMEADVNADVLLSEMVGALMLARAEPDEKRSDQILMRARTALKTKYNLESFK